MLNIIFLFLFPDCCNAKQSSCLPLSLESCHSTVTTFIVVPLHWYTIFYLHFTSMQKCIGIKIILSRCPQYQSTVNPGLPFYNVHYTPLFWYGCWMATMHKLQVQCKWHTDGWQKITKSGATTPPHTMDLWRLKIATKQVLLHGWLLWMADRATPMCHIC